MQKDVIKMLRYNTGTDKKAFVAFKQNFDAVIFNATIVAYSGSAISDLVSVHKNQYIIDPQTHIMQHDIIAIMSKDKKTGCYSIKKSVEKYLEQLPAQIMHIIKSENRPLNITEINGIVDELVSSVYEFETGYVNTFIEAKEYDKYLKYAKVGPQPRVVVAPYFMLKKGISNSDKSQFLDLNNKCLQKFIKYNQSKAQIYPVAAQLVMDREILREPNLIERLKGIYSVAGYEYIFLWINDFSTLECSREEKELFYNLLDMLNKIGKKPLMAYGGYDSILLSHEQMKARLYGTAQSVGYGEARAITPVGGGLPVNKYYFEPLHKRMRFDEALSILMNTGYFSLEKSNKEHADDYYLDICNCETCKDVITDDIDNFKIYNDSVPYIVKARYGEIKRNRPTTNATLIAAFHFLHCKMDEWNQVEINELNVLMELLKENFKRYGSEKEQINIEEWCEIFAR